MRIVIALGGNALGITPKEQKENTDLLAKSVLPLFKEDNEIIFTHGNGPQIGLVNLAFEEGQKHNDKVYDMPLPECNGMTQGYIGYHLQNSLANEFKANNINKKIASIVTQIEVDPNDPGFLNPTKPIGSYFSKEEADKLPYTFKFFQDKGYRRVVASPKPLNIIEQDQIKCLLDNKFVVIGCGGGGIPVVNKDGKLGGIDAVIDKDLSSAVLAKGINADVLLILTAISNATIFYKQPNEQNLGKIGLKEMTKLYNDGHFGAGSMGPKVEACLNFVKANPKGVAIITNIESAYEAIHGRAGTIITSEE